MGTGRVLAAALSVLLALGCGGSDESGSAEPGPEESWGEAALQWLDALEVAAVNGPPFLAPFLAEDLVWEDRIDAVLIEGREQWLDAQIVGGRIECFLPRGCASYFVSAEGVLGQRTIETGFPVSWLDRMVIGPDGLRQWVRAGSVAAGRHFQHWRSDFDMLDGLVDRYAAMWRGSSDLDPASVYAADAVISDTLLGKSVSGLTAIDRSVDSGRWPSLGRISIVDLPHDGGPAVHIAPSDEDWMGPEELGLVIEADDGAGCPGSMAVVLGLDGDRVRWERRYHDIESVRRCEDLAALRPGWWEEIGIPPAVQEKTGTLVYGAMEIDVFDGAAELHAFLEWGLARFEDAGLEVPQVDSVTFLDARVDCYQLGGRTTPSGRGAAITLCRTRDDICLDDACRHWRARDRQLWLHELAHPWLDAHTGPATRAEVLALVDLPRWSDPDDPWAERGVERAADAVAYGLMDEPVDIASELGVDCEERLATFRILTGTEPFAACAR